MEKFSLLVLSKIPYVSSSYSNRWWAKALQRSIEINGDSQLRTLTELHLQLEVAKSRNEYLYYPVFVDHVDIEPGFYHLNIQTSSHMFVGWMHIKKDNSIAWWGQGGGDSVNVGCAGHQNCVVNFGEADEFSDQIEWIGAIQYKDKYPPHTSIKEILKPFG